MTYGISTKGTALLGLGLAALGLSACNTKPAQQAAAAVSNPCGPSAAALSSAMPQNVGTSASAVDCFAWASFVALNWQADPARPGYPDGRTTAILSGQVAVIAFETPHPIVDAYPCPIRWRDRVE